MAHGKNGKTLGSHPFQECHASRQEDGAPRSWGLERFTPWCPFHPRLALSAAHKAALGKSSGAVAEDTGTGASLDLLLE